MSIVDELENTILTLREEIYAIKNEVRFTTWFMNSVFINPDDGVLHGDGDFMDADFVSISLCPFGY